MGRLNFPDTGPGTPDRNATDRNVTDSGGTRPGTDHNATDPGVPRPTRSESTAADSVAPEPVRSRPDTPERDVRDIDQERDLADDPPLASELAEIYGRPIPHTALILAGYLEHGRVPLRDPEHPQHVVTLNLPVAVHEFGSNLDATWHYLHRLHATGGLTVAADGTVEFGPAVHPG